MDGGVSNNDFIAQLVADLTGLRVERPLHTEMSSLGCAHVVGLQLGICRTVSDKDNDTIEVPKYVDMTIMVGQ